MFGRPGLATSVLSGIGVTQVDCVPVDSPLAPSLASGAMALTELSGRPLGTQKVIIERGPVRVFAQALIDDDAVYSSDNAPVPPTFPFVMPYWGSMGVGGAAGLPIENLRGKGRAILHGEQEFVYHGGEWPHVGRRARRRGFDLRRVREGRSPTAASSSSTSPRRRGRTSSTGKPVVTTKFTLAINCKPGADEAKPLSS